ncbi:hypothetical protein RHSIM_Rhsim07G0171500 [Rhododendron simsii]|uniref:ARM repeat superfamily protein n=1 Tax=Rhododendron simsii TaxID=118357 RepID=A0A834GLQ2_RHOSS|nr:hypothetical protein RHSIM_Rhsim07G0171500 [Rhododendron simsii]
MVNTRSGNGTFDNGNDPHRASTSGGNNGNNPNGNLGGLDVAQLAQVIAAAVAAALPQAKLVRELNSSVAIRMGGLDYDKELVLRQSRSKLVLAFVEFSVEILDREMKSDDQSWSESCIKRTINKFLFKHMGDAMNNEVLIQKNHRRARALSRFINIINSINLSKVITNEVLVPLFSNMVFKLQNGKDENVMSACLEALESISEANDCVVEASKACTRGLTSTTILRRCSSAGEVVIASMYHPSVINFLKNRLESTECLQFIVKVLSATLNWTIGWKSFLSVVETDILGDVSEEKEKLLTLKVKSKLESMLNNIAAGIECNPSVDQSDLFVFLYTLIEDGVAYETDRNKSFSVLNTSKQSGNEAISKIITLGKLVDSLQSSHLDDIISDTLRCLVPLVRRLLPALKSQADKIRTSLLVIAHGSITSSLMMQSCLRFLAVLLHNTQITLSEDQWHVLIQCPLFSDLEKTVLEMLHAFVIKFPKHNLDEVLNTIFMHLVLCLANDIDNNVRSMTGAAIKLLIGYVTKNLIPLILEFSLSWHSGGVHLVQSAPAQVMGLLVEATGEDFKEEYINHVLHVMTSIFQLAVNVLKNRQLGLSVEATDCSWKETYYSLVLLEKILHQFHGLCLAGHLEANRTNHEKPPLIDDAASTLITRNLTFTTCALHSLFVPNELVGGNSIWSTLEHHEHSRFLEAFQLLDSLKGRSMFASRTFGFDNQSVEEKGDRRSLLVYYLLKRMGKDCPSDGGCSGGPVLPSTIMTLVPN